jgi:Flp pilus assembly protein TadD
MASRRRSRKPSQGQTARERLARRADPATPGVWLRAAIVVLVGAIAYSNALTGPFVLDDQDTVVLNDQIRDLSPSVVLFPAVELPVAGRPIVNLSFALNHAVGGLDVVGYHVVNVALHIVCALLLFGVVRRTLAAQPFASRWGLGSSDLAFAAALVWLVHPLQTDAVDYVTQRTELMMGLFYLLTFYASIRALRFTTDEAGGARVRLKGEPTRTDPTGTDSTEKPAATGGDGDQSGGGGIVDAGVTRRPRYAGDDARWLAVAVIACALGMASKESMVTAPFMLLVYDRIFVFDSWSEAWRRRSWLYLALAATWLLLAALVWQGPRSRSAGFSSGVSPWTYLLNQAEMIVRYLRLAVWPRGLVVDYGAPRALTFVEVLPAAMLVTALAALTIVALKIRPKLGFLGLWFFTTLSPTSSIVPIATEVGAERRMYLPLAALVILAVIAAAWLLHAIARRARSDASGPLASDPAIRRARLAGLTLLALVALALGVATMARNREYASRVTLAQTNVERWPTPRARHSLGVALVGEGRYDEGITVLREAVDGDPAARYTLGAALFQQGRLDQSIAELRTFLAGESFRLEVPIAHEMIGRALKAQGRCEEAIKEFRQVLKMAPASGEVYGLLAECLLRQQQFEEAVVQYEEFLRRRPTDLSALMQLGIVYTALGRYDDAIARFRRVVELNPRDSGAHRNLARALLDNGSAQEALPYAREAVRLSPDDPVAHDQLGVALARLGDLDGAIGELRRASELDPNDPEIRAHLAEATRLKEGGTRAP